MLSKLKYVGIKREDLLTIYKLFIRSCLEYCSVVFHSSLTIEQIKAIERIQKVSLKIILGSDYTDYQTALQTCNLKKLHLRREQRMLDFAHKSLKHPKHNQMFPISKQFHSNPFNIRSKEKFHVNASRTETYKNSSIPYMQRLLHK